MIKPKEYRVKDGVMASVFLDNGFTEKLDCYFIKKPVYHDKVYGDMIYAHIFIYKEDNWMTVKVQDSNGNMYSPFGNSHLNHNNKVAETTIRNYNKYMDDLVKNNILEEVKGCPRIDNSERILIKYHTDIEKLSNIDGSKSDWIDLRAAEDVFIPKNESKLISLGVSMKLPDRYEAHVVPRSSTFKNFGIIQTNHCGIIDNSYSGTDDIWKFSAYCLNPKDVVKGVPGTLIHKNDRICQFRIMKKQPTVVFDEVDKLDDNDRGGFGSTGRK